jgi:hypothetical protein
MSAEFNPYMPPEVEEPSVRPMGMPDGCRWRIEEGKLLVRDLASLPDVCIFGAPEAEPGLRVSVPLAVNASLPFLGKKIRVMVYQSHQARATRRRKKWTIWMVTALLAVVTAILRDAIRQHESIFLPTMLCLGAVSGWWLRRSNLQIMPGKDGWYELRGTGPDVIGRLEEIQKRETISQEPARSEKKQ